MDISQDHDLIASRCNHMAMRRASRRISQYYDSCLAPTGLRATQFAILAILRATGGLSLNRLAEALDLDRSTAGQNMRPLQRLGLLDIVRSPDDGRSRVVQLTAAGAERLDAALPLWRAAQDRFEAMNGVAEAAALRITLGALRLPAR